MARRQISDVADIGARLVALRKAAGFTQQALAQEVGVSRRVIAYYEGETQHPPTTILPRLAQALGVSADELLDGNGRREALKPNSIRLQRKLQQLDQLGAKTIYPTGHGAKRKACIREVYHEDDIRVVQGDSRGALAEFSDNTFQCCITSPPYWGLRDYGIAGQIGAENDPAAYIADLLSAA